MNRPVQPPLLASGEVHVWQVDLSLEPGPRDAEALSDEERSRASRFAFERDRRRYVASHVALRNILAAYLARAPRDVAIEAGLNGKPHLAGNDGLAFNLSHGGDVAMVAVGTAAALGVDVEPSGRRSGLRDLAASVFTPGEIRELASLDEDALAEAFLTAWTRKEACLKAIGLGLAHEPRWVHVGTRKDRLRICLGSGGAGPCAEVVSLATSRDCVAALAVVGEWKEVTLLPWPTHPRGHPIQEMPEAR